MLGIVKKAKTKAKKPVKVAKRNKVAMEYDQPYSNGIVI